MLTIIINSQYLESGKGKCLTCTNSKGSLADSPLEIEDRNSAPIHKDAESKIADIVFNTVEGQKGRIPIRVQNVHIYTHEKEISSDELTGGMVEII